MLSKPKRRSQQHSRHCERPDCLVLAVAVWVVSVSRFPRYFHLRAMSTPQQLCLVSHTAHRVTRSEKRSDSECPASAIRAAEPV